MIYFISEKQFIQSNIQKHGASVFGGQMSVLKQNQLKSAQLSDNGIVPLPVDPVLNSLRREFLAGYFELDLFVSKLERSNQYGPQSTNELVRITAALSEALNILGCFSGKSTQGAMQFQQANYPVLAADRKLLCHASKKVSKLDAIIKKCLKEDHSFFKPKWDGRQRANIFAGLIGDLKGLKDHLYSLDQKLANTKYPETHIRQQAISNNQVRETRILDAVLSRSVGNNTPLLIVLQDKLYQNLKDPNGTYDIASKGIRVWDELLVEKTNEFVLKNTLLLTDDKQFEKEIFDLSGINNLTTYISSPSNLPLNNCQEAHLLLPTIPNLEAESQVESKLNTSPKMTNLQGGKNEFIAALRNDLQKISSEYECKVVSKEVVNQVRLNNSGLRISMTK